MYLSIEEAKKNGFIDSCIRIKNDIFDLLIVKDAKQNNYSDIFDAVSMTSEITECLEDCLLDFCNQECSSVGFLAKIAIDKTYRGQGIGNDLMQFFNIANKETDMNFLLAKIKNKQANGFCLKTFYEKFGFKPVIESCDELLMVNKEMEHKIKSFLIRKHHFIY